MSNKARSESGSGQVLICVVLFISVSSFGIFFINNQIAEAEAKTAA